MKGLILKDLYMVWNYCKTVVFVCIIFLASSVFVEGSFFFSVYPMVIAGIIPFTIMVYEEKNQMGTLLPVIPHNKKTGCHGEIYSFAFVYSFGSGSFSMLCSDKSYNKQC